MSISNFYPLNLLFLLLFTLSSSPKETLKVIVSPMLVFLCRNLDYKSQSIKYSTTVRFHNYGLSFPCFYTQSPVPSHTIPATPPSLSHPFLCTLYLVHSISTRYRHLLWRSMYSAGVCYPSYYLGGVLLLSLFALCSLPLVRECWHEAAHCPENWITRILSNVCFVVDMGRNRYRVLEVLGIGSISKNRHCQKI